MRGPAEPGANTQMYQVDPPDLPLWPTMRRLLALWRGEWRHVAVGLVCALLYSTINSSLYF